MICSYHQRLQTSRLDPIRTNGKRQEAVRKVEEKKEEEEKEQ